MDFKNQSIYQSYSHDCQRYLAFSSGQHKWLFISQVKHIQFVLKGGKERGREARRRRVKEGREQRISFCVFLVKIETTTS